MNSTKKLGLGARLALGFGIVILLGTVVAATGWLTLRALKGHVDVLVDDRVATIGTLNEMVDNSNVIARGLRNLLLMKDEAQLRQETTRLDATRARNAAARTKLQSMLRDERSRTLFDALETVRRPYAAAIDKTQRLARDGQVAEATAVLFAEVRPAQDVFFGAVNTLMEYQKQQMHATATAARDTADTAGAWLAGLATAATLMGVVIARALTRSVTRAVGGEPEDAMRVASAIAEGDLTVGIPVRETDGNSILAAMRTMRDRLAEVVDQVRASSESVAAGSAQIATGNADLSQRTEEQASNLQQTAASMEELTITVQTNAQVAAEAHRLATDASKAAARGGADVERVVATIAEVAASSRRIAEIIGVIDGIAFQTNILALNAAVEAARAGGQGRGFAVVATEVRSLAQRSANAAKEIKALIEQSSRRVDAGVKQVDAAGATMQEIVVQARRVSELVGEISNASAQQASGISQVGSAVLQLDQVTQQNAALVEESAAAAESLSAQATRLTAVVSVFRMAA
jgi:methyl-accepting chemotaxis protein